LISLLVELYAFIGSGAKAAGPVSDDGQVPRFVSVEELFKGRHFDQEIVVLCVRWYLSYKLSYRDLVAMMGERGIVMAHTTILRWVQRYTPEFEKRWKRFARTVRIPTKITLDAYAASHRSVADLKQSGELPKRVRVRSSKYLNNTIEQDHRRVKQRVRPMLGLEEFPKRGGCDQRNRVGGEDQEGPIQTRQVRRIHHASDMASRSGDVTRISSIERGKTDRLPCYVEFAPEPTARPRAHSLRVASRFSWPFAAHISCNDPDRPSHEWQ
jgi:hypothetical protein